MIQRLWIGGQLPGMNEIVEAAKGAGGTGRIYSAMKKQWTDHVWALAKVARLRPMEVPAVLVFVWRELTRRRDKDNIAAAKKFVVDGLVTAGVLAGDGWKGVAGFVDRFEVVSHGHEGVEVMIEAALGAAPPA